MWCKLGINRDPGTAPTPTWISGNKGRGGQGSSVVGRKEQETGHLGRAEAREWGGI